MIWRGETPADPPTLAAGPTACQSGGGVGQFNENVWAIFTENRAGFSTQYSVWTTALKTAQAASPVDQKLVNKLKYLSEKCREVA
ncbi:hypothetical protein B0H10DRAFT_2217393 [Mycena sp. CBHHK59/15]|nr:hypothetical protein B0H10DRAFT_2217393 [Mycena sp. CBHHK59/15]